MIVHTMRARQALMALLVGAVVVCIAGCPNLSRDLDMKAQIQGDVLEANAEQVAIRVQAESEAMGVTSPSGPSTAKVGVPFLVSTTVSPEYAFLRWEQEGGNGEVVFADAAKTETEATVTKKGEGILIVARFDARPAVIIKDPDGGEGILRNRKITLTFSEPVDPSTVSFETISVEERPRNYPDQPLVSIVDRLTLSANQAVVMILPKDGMSYDPQNYVWVKVTKNIKDVAGNMMKEDFSWYFITGNSSDVTNPVINSFKIKVGATELPPDGKTRSRQGLSLTTAVFDDGEVKTIRVTETAVTDIAEAPISGVQAVTEWGYDVSLPYDLQTPGDGRKKIEVLVFDSVGHPSDASLSSTLILDTTGPVATSFSANCGAWTNGNSVEILHTVSDGGALGSLPDDIKVNFRVGAGAWIDAGDFDATQTSPTISGEGAIAISAKYRDELGNETSAASIAANSTVTVNRDSIAPVISSFQIDHGTYPGYTTIQGIAVSFSAADTGGSGVSGFQVTESATPSGLWTPWTGGTVSGSAFTIGDPEGAHTVRVHMRDVAGNVGTASDLVTLDHTEPTVGVSFLESPDSFVKNGDLLHLTATFTEANGLSGVPAITIAGTTVNAAPMGGSGLVWTYAWTVNEDAGMDADVVVSIDAVDMVGLPNTAATGATAFRIDNVAPAAAGTPSYLSGPWVNRAVNDAGFALSVSLPTAEADPSKNAKAGDTLRLLRNGAPWNEVSLVQADVDARSRTVSIGARELGVNGGSEDEDKLITVRLIDAAGNEGPVCSSELLLKLETTLPGVALTASGHPDMTVRNGDVVSFTATFTEAVAATPVLTIAGGGAVANTGGSGTTWTYSWTVSAVADMDADRTVAVSAADAAGNPNSAATGAVSFHIDNVAPGVALTASGHPDTTVKNGDVVSFTATFTEAVAATPVLTIAGGGAVANTGGSGTTWTYSWTVSAVADMDADRTVAVSAADAAGNPSSAATGAVSFHIDNVKPVISSVTLSDEPTKNEIATVAFSEPVFSNADATGALVGSSEVGHSDLVVTDTSADADITAWVINPVHTAGSDTLTINLTWAGTPTRDVDKVRVAAESAASVYDTAGNAMPAGSGEEGTARHLSIQVPPASGAAVATKPASVSGGSHWVQPQLPESQVPERPQPKQVPPRAKPSPAPRQTTTGVEPLAQFHRPIVSPDKPKPEIRDTVVQRAPTVAETTESRSPVPIARGNGTAATAAAPAAQRSQARIALPEADGVSSIAGPPPDAARASSIPVVGIFILGAVLFLFCGWFGVVFLRRWAARR